MVYFKVVPLKKCLMTLAALVALLVIAALLLPTLADYINEAYSDSNEVTNDESITTLDLSQETQAMTLWQRIIYNLQKWYKEGFSKR